jgi:nucleotide-binding universal stress UspA family protein
METQFSEKDVRADQTGNSNINNNNTDDATSISETSTQTQIPLISVKKILLAIDKSGYKTKAMRFAITLAKGLGAEVTAIHIIDKFTLRAAVDVLGYYRGGKIEEYKTAYENRLKKQAEELLEEVKVLGDNEGVKITTEVLLDVHSIPNEIIDYAENKKMDIIVIGTKGMTGIAKFFMGNVANTVAAHASSPVLLIR